MLDNIAYNRAINALASSKIRQEGDIQLFLEEEYRSSKALAELGMSIVSSPSILPGINILQGPFKWITNFSIPYTIEVMGMPNSFKTTAINSLLADTWVDGTRKWYMPVSEGGGMMRDEYYPLKQEYPFLYSMLVGLGSWLASRGSSGRINEFKMLLQDRGSYDVSIFRRTLSSMGHVNIIDTEKMWEYGLGQKVLPVGGVVLCLQRPEVSIERGTTMNIAKLQLLYMQYLRFYQEMRKQEKLVPSFIALDMETDPQIGIAMIKDAIRQIVYRPLNTDLIYPRR